jgi:AcrR family transcriptional regulator
MPDLPPIRDFKAARVAMGAETRSSLLLSAINILKRDGPNALTVRRVAEDVNASTKLIYTHFGGKNGLFEAVYLESFAALTKAFKKCLVDEEPNQQLLRVTRAYRDFALSEPDLYSVMFGDLGVGWEVPLQARRQAWQSFKTMRDVLSRCLTKENESESERAAYLLWAAMHGVVSLEIRKLLGESQDREGIFYDAVQAACAQFGVSLDVTTQKDIK